VITHAAFLSDSIREYATVVFPLESAAEKEGTVTHPDGRIQRMRPAIARQGEVHAEWQVLSELARRLGYESGVRNGASASSALFEAVPFYGGLDLEALAGHGRRWQERPQAAALPAPGPAPTLTAPAAPAPTAPAAGRLRLGRYRSIWAAPEVEASPALHFLIARQHVELHPDDARRLGVGHGEEVFVSDESGARVRGQVVLREAVPAGTAFLERGLAAESADALPGSSVAIEPAPAIVVIELIEEALA